LPVPVPMSKIRFALKEEGRGGEKVEEADDAEDIEEADGAEEKGEAVEADDAEDAGAEMEKQENKSRMISCCKLDIRS
jgi:hypothetical protein